MRKVLLTTGLIIIIFSGLLSGCITIGGGGGTPVTKSFNYSNFTKIQIGNAFNFQVTYGQTFSVSIDATNTTLARTIVSQSGDTLKIQLSGWFIGFHNTANVSITMPRLLGIDASGACHGNASGFQSSDDFNVKLSGASGLDVDMKSGNLQADISGVSSLKGTLNATSVLLYPMLAESKIALISRMMPFSLSAPIRASALHSEIPALRAMHAKGRLTIGKSNCR